MRLMDSQEWRLKAICRGKPYFFPRDHKRRPADLDALDKARALCRECPVRRECLEYALVNNLRYGIWGGYTHRERLKILRERKRARRLVAS